MINIFRKRRGDSASDPPGDDTTLLGEFDALDPERRETAAAQFSQFWDWFTEEFGGPMGFLSQSNAQQQQYRRKVETLAKQSRTKKEGGDFSSVYYGAALLNLYIKALQSGRSGTGDLELMARIDAIAEQGRQLRAAGVKPPVAPE